MSVSRAPQVEIATWQVRAAIALGTTLLGTLIAPLVFALTRGAGWLLEWATPAGFAISALAVYFLEAGVLAVLLDLARLPELVAAAGAALFGWVVVVGPLFFVQAGEGGEVEEPSGPLGPIHTIESHKNGRVASRYYYRTLHDYRPRSAQDSRSLRRR